VGLFKCAAAVPRAGGIGADLMSALMNVGLIGLGAIGRLHFDCWRKSRVARLVAVSARDRRKLEGDWSGQEFNLGNQAAARIDMSGLALFERAEELIADPRIQIVDICMPTPLHAPLTIAALRAGKHVLCEKPMALALEECHAMENAARETGRQLMIGHCLRFWPHYLKAREIIASGEFGKPLHAHLARTGALPAWSSEGWLMNAQASGGILDMHIHDIDIALWWFGRPRFLNATGYLEGDLPRIIDALWRYPDSFTVHLHSAWDRNGGPFRHAFKVVLERATLSYDLLANPESLRIFENGVERTLPMEQDVAYQAELDGFAQSVAAGEPMQRVPASESRAAVEVGLEELRQLRENARAQ
jgi:predicted dehydrogenase